MSKKFLSQIQSTVATGTAPLIVASTTAVANLNADLLDGQHGSYFAPIASPTFTGTVTAPLISLTTVDTATASSHYIVETASDGTIRPKTLANVRTEIVTTAAVNSAAATTVGTITSGIWNAGSVTSSGGISGTTGTFSGAVSVTDGATADASPGLVINGVSGMFSFFNSLSAGSYNGLVALNDKGIIFNNGSIDTGNIVIGPHASSATGIKVSAATQSIRLGGLLIDLQGVADTAIAATHYFVETATDGHIRPKTLANVKLEILTSAELSGTPTAPTAAVSTNTTQIATTAYVNAEIANDAIGKSGLQVITQAAGSTINTAGQVNTFQILQGTAGSDAFMTFHIAGDYAAHFGIDGTTNDLSYGGWSVGAAKYRVWHAGNQTTLFTSPALTGTPTAPTATAGTNTTQIATTAFVTTAAASSGTSLDPFLLAGL